MNKVILGERSIMEIKKVGVVGCGTMGSGITQVCAQSGYQVVVSEVNDELLNKGLASINSFLTKSVDKGKTSQQDKDSALARIKGTINTKDFSDCDLMIEAATENMDLKKRIFAELDEICPKHTILATGTSILSPTEIGSAAKRRDKTIGMHWFNPVPLMRLVEVTAGLETSEKTVEAVMEFAKRMGKTPVRVNEAPGGIVSRILNAMRNVAIDILAEGVASAEDIDTAMKLGANWPMGPLELTDLTGVDLQLTNSENLVRELGSPKYTANPLLRKMVRAGHLGRKTGKGFYDYTKKGG